MPNDRPKRRDYGPRRRRESLDALLDSLSAWDLLHIRSRFIDGSVRLDGFAGLSELPPEVFAYIIPHLGLRDVLNCYLVSRDWREAWMQGAVASALCSRFFPGLLELYHNDVPDRNQLFRATAQQYMRKLYVKRSFVAWDVGWSSDIFTNAEDPPASRQLGNLREVNFGFGPLTVHYSSGKLAWQPDNCHVIVDDLYTRERSRFSFGMDFISGRPLQLQAVTDSLVVLATSLPQHQSRHQTTTDNGQTMYVISMSLSHIILTHFVEQCFTCSSGSLGMSSSRASLPIATPRATQWRLLPGRAMSSCGAGVTAPMSWTLITSSTFMSETGGRATLGAQASCFTQQTRTSSMRRGCTQPCSPVSITNNFLRLSQANHVSLRCRSPHPHRRRHQV